MKRIRIDDLEELSEMIIDSIEDGEGPAVVGYYDTIAYILTDLICATDLELASINLHDQEYDGYEEAYYLEIFEGGIYIDQAQCDKHDRYVLMENDTTYVEEDFEKEYLEVNSPDGVVIFGMHDVDKEEHECNHDETCLCYNEDHTGFSFCVSGCDGVTKFKYKGTKKLSEDEVWKIIEEQFS